MTLIVMEASRKVLSRSLVGQKITFFPQCFQYTQNPPTYLVETVCEMDICQVGGKTLGIADKVFTSLVTCQGLGKCTKKVHPCCTVTPRACAHPYCCSQKLHDITGNRRLYMCDTCMQALVCNKVCQVDTRGHW